MSVERAGGPSGPQPQAGVPSPGRTPRCPQCGAGLEPPAPGGVGVQICAYCRTVVVYGTAPRALGRAVGPRAERLAPGAWLQALTCRLCGGPLPAAAVQADPRQVRCDYCGHRARLAPGILSVLRVAVTRPRTLPPRLRRSVLFWVAAWTVGLLVLLPLAIFRNDVRDHHRIAVVAAPTAGHAEVSLEVPAYFKGPLRLSFHTVEPPAGRTCVAVRLRKGRAEWHDARVLRPGRQHESREVSGVGPGTYEVRVQATAREPTEVVVKLGAWGSLELGWIIATLNFLLLLMALELARSPFNRPAPRRRRLARSLLGVWFLVLLAVAVFRWNPWPAEDHPGPSGPMACDTVPEEPATPDR